MLSPYTRESITRVIVLLALLAMLGALAAYALPRLRPTELLAAPAVAQGEQRLREAPSAAALATPTPTVNPPLDPVIIAPLLPDAAYVLRLATADWDADGRPEIVVLAGFGPRLDRLSYDYLELFVVDADRAPLTALAWRSGPLRGQRAEKLQFRDMTGDGSLELLSLQHFGAAGQTLYVLAWRGNGYDLLRPYGGYFDGQDGFGDVGVRLEDDRGDGVVHILAEYGAASRQTEVYRWDGSRYVCSGRLLRTRLGTGMA